MTACFYCGEPIAANQERVEGKEAAAHRSCVHVELDRIKPDWRESNTLLRSMCRHGHLYIEGSFYRHKDGVRKCKACKSASDKRSKLKKRAAGAVQ